MISRTIPWGSFHSSIISQPYVWIECISLNLHSRVKIEDESHGCRSKFSTTKSQRSGGCCTTQNEDVNLSLLPFLFLSLKGSLVITVEITVSPKLVIKWEEEMWKQQHSGKKFSRLMCDIPYQIHTYLLYDHSNIFASCSSFTTV